MKRNNILLVSIDAVKPDILFNQEKYGIKLQTLNQLMKEGSFTRQGNTSVFPSFTYCAHQSIITGCHPEKHGMQTNKLFDPFNEHLGAWYWYVNHNVPTLWQEAKENGYFTVNVGFPTSVNAPTDLNIPEYWRDTTKEDSELLAAISIPQGLSRECEEAIGTNIPCGLWALEDDETKLEQCRWMLKEQVAKQKGDQPVFMTTYFASYDDLAHNVGTYDETALSYLQRTDELLGELVRIARAVLGDDLVICVISDHGMMDNLGDVNVNAEFKRQGLITLNEKDELESYRAFCQRSGGVGLINVSEESEIPKVRALLEKMQKDHPDMITDVMTGAEAQESRMGCGNYDLIVTTAPGWEIREDFSGNLIKHSTSQKAQHGYDETCDDMKAIFVIAGGEVPVGREIEGHSIVDIAPTLAGLMGFEMPQAQGVNMLG